MYKRQRLGKQEKLFHEVIFQIGNCGDMAVGTEEGELAVKILDEFLKDFEKRNPTLRLFNCYLHLDESTPHLHVDFVPYVSGWTGKGMDTKVSLKQALKSLGFPGGSKRDTELNQWINHEKEVLAEVAKKYGIEWEQKGTHEAVSYTHLLVISLKYFFMCIIIDIGIWMYMLVYDFGVLEINALKYEDEMQFLEKVRIAQNFNNTVLLDQYAKEKMVRYLPVSYTHLDVYKRQL